MLRIYVFLGCYLVIHGLWFVCGPRFPTVEEIHGLDQSEVARVREPDEIGLPESAGEGAWEVGTTPRDATTRSVRFGKYLPKQFRFWSAAVAPQAGKAVLTVLDKSDPDNENVTRALFCDLTRGVVVAQWNLPEMIAPMAIHPRGNIVLFCRRDRYLSERETLYIGRCLPDGNMTLDLWRPLVDPEATDFKKFQDHQEIMWAAFAGTDRIVTLNDEGKLYIWDLHDLRRLGIVTGVVGTPTLTPDGRNVALLTEDMVVLLDLDAMQITRAHRLGTLPKEPVVSIHPDGRSLAVAGKGQAIVLDLISFDQTDALLNHLSTNPGMDLTMDFAWFGKYLYTKNRLYDIDSPVAVWEFNGAKWSQPAGRSLWAVVRTRNSRSKSGDYILRSFSIPAKDLESRIAKVFRNSDVIALGPGDRVRIDVSGIPEHRQNETYRVLERRLAEHGFQASNSAMVTLQAAIDPETRPDTVTYRKAWGIGPDEPRTYKYEKRNATLKFIRQNKVLWTAAGSKKPPFMLHGMPDGDVLPDAGRPDYEMFEKRRLPLFIRGDHGAGALGRTKLTAEGLEFDEDRR